MTAPQPEPERGSIKPALGLLLLCLLWAVDSLRSELFPQFAAGRVAPMKSETAGLVLLALAAGLFALLRSTPWPRGKQVLTAVAIGLGLFAVPAVLLALANPFVSGSTRVAIFSLAPLIIVVLEPYLVGEAYDSPDLNPQVEDLARPAKAGLLGALAAIAGTLLVFPVHLFSTFQSTAAAIAILVAAATVAAANCAAVRHAQSLRRQSIAPTIAIAAAAAAIPLAIACAFAGNAAPPAALLPLFAHAVAIDLPSLLLLFWLMPRMAASRMTTRFVLAPLFTIMLGLAFEPATVGPRGWSGLLLIAAGGGWLLFAPAQEPDSNHSLFKI